MAFWSHAHAEHGSTPILIEDVACSLRLTKALLSVVGASHLSQGLRLDGPYGGGHVGPGGLLAMRLEVSFEQVHQATDPAQN